MLNVKIDKCHNKVTLKCGNVLFLVPTITIFFILVNYIYKKLRKKEIQINCFVTNASDSYVNEFHNYFMFSY